MSPFGRLDVSLLALLLTYAFVVVIHVYVRFHLARPGRLNARVHPEVLAAALNIELGGLKSIALTAPYFGLAGTCEGILSAFGGASMAHHAYVVMVATRLALALVPTAAAIPVAVLATCFYNFLRTRIDLVECEAIDQWRQSARHLRSARRFSSAKRLSHFPSFGLIAVPALVFATAGCMTFGSFHTPKGFYVALPSGRCESDSPDRLIVLHLSGTDKLFLNLEQQHWNSLAARLSDIYRGRKGRELYLLADSDVPFQTVAHALDTVESSASTVGSLADVTRNDKLGLKVSLVTPKMLDGGCVETSSAH